MFQSRRVFGKRGQHEARHVHDAGERSPAGHPHGAQGGRGDRGRLRPPRLRRVLDRRALHDAERAGDLPLHVPLQPHRADRADEARHRRGQPAAAPPGADRSPRRPAGSPERRAADPGREPRRPRQRLRDVRRDRPAGPPRDGGRSHRDRAQALVHGAALRHQGQVLDAPARGLPLAGPRRRRHDQALPEAAPAARGVRHEPGFGRRAKRLRRGAGA